jgi:hypothetical protein
MNPKNLPKYREQFNKCVDRAIRECSRQTGVTDLETVYRSVKRSASMLLRRLKVLLADEQVRIIIQKRLKRCTVSMDDAAKDAAQMEFDFFEMEQFRGVGQRITYPEGKEMKYVEYNRSLEWQRVASIAHLDAGIAADKARRSAQAAANQFLEPLVKRYGDMPAEELVQSWMRDQRNEAAGGG